MNDLLEDDDLLFRNLSYESMTENERFFFETMKERLTEDCSNNDILMDDESNDLGIFLVRFSFDWFKMSRYGECQGLRDILNATLDGYGKPNVTLLEYLKEKDFSVIKYDSID